MRRANYTIESQDLEFLVIRDIGPWDQHPTVTNDAEEVVKHLIFNRVLKPGQRLLYIDSDGRKDELLVIDGKFAGFKPYDP